KLAGDLRKSLGTALSPAIDDVDGATFDPAELVQPLHKYCNPCALVCRSARTKEADGRQFAWLLRARREQPRRRTAEKRDELAPSHSGRLLHGQHDMFVRSPTEHDVWSSRVVGRCGIAVQHFRNAGPTDHYVWTRLHPLLARRRAARERIVVAGV